MVTDATLFAGLAWVAALVLGAVRRVCVSDQAWGFRVLLGIVSAVGLLAVGAGGAAAAPAWLAPVDVSTGQGATSPAVAMDPAGDAAVVWQRFNGTNEVVQASVRAAGGSFGSPVYLSAPGQNAQVPQVAMDAAGDAVAVWQRSNGTNVVVQASVRPAGGSFGAPVDVSAGGENGFFPRVAMDPAGDTIVVWDGGPGPSSIQIVQASVRPAGGSFGPRVNVSAAGQSTSDPLVAMDPVGDAIVAWQRDTSSSQIVEAAMRAAGGSFGSPAQLSGSSAGEIASTPQVAMDAAGDAVAVWDLSIGANTMVQSSVRPSGGIFGSPVNVSSAGKNGDVSQLAMDRAGDAIVAWEQFNATGSSSTVQASVRVAGSFGTPVNLSAPGADAQFPQVAMDPAGDAVVAWQRFDASSVQASESAPDGSFSSPVDLSAAGESAFIPQVAMDQAGDAVTVWEQDIGGTGAITRAASYDFVGPQLRGLHVPASGTARQPVSVALSPFDTVSGVVPTRWSFGDGQSADGDAVTHTYAAAGTYQITVTATGGVGDTTTATRTITIANAPPAPPTATTPTPTPMPPLLSSLHVSPRTFSLAGRKAGDRCVKPTKTNEHRPACRRRVTLEVRYTLNAAARVTFKITGSLPGRKAKRRCATQTRKNRHSKKCMRYVTLRGPAARTGNTGANRLVLVRKLAPGSYILTAAPARGRPEHVTFKVVA